jgi:hypothetical protein
MGEIVFIVTAICRTTGCVASGIPNVYEREDGIDFVVHCGQCQNQIGDITLSEKD